MFRSAGQFSLLLQPSDAVLCQTKMFSFSGKGGTGAGRVDMLSMLCVILHSMRHFPEGLEKLVKEISKIHCWGFWVFVCAFFFSMGQITVGRFNGHYYIRKKAEGDSMPDVMSPSVVSLCVLQSLKHRLY